MRSKVYVKNKRFDVQAERAEDATEAARKVYEEFKKQVNRRKWEEQGAVHEQVDDETHETILSERRTWFDMYCGKHDVRVIDWKKKKKGRRKGRKDGSDGSNWRIQNQERGCL